MSSQDLSSVRRARSRRCLAAVGGTLLLVTAVAACSSNDAGPSPAGTVGTQPGTTVAGVKQMTDEQRVAEAKTQAVGYFEALATLDYGKAEDRSSGAAASVVIWTQGTNDIEATKGTPYAVSYTHLTLPTIYSV